MCTEIIDCLENSLILDLKLRSADLNFQHELVIKELSWDLFGRKGQKRIILEIRSNLTLLTPLNKTAYSDAADDALIIYAIKGPGALNLLRSDRLEY